MNRTFLVAASLFSALTLVILGGGCEAIVGSTVPAFSCTPGSAASCPPGKVCSPTGACVSACPDTPCTAGQRCVDAVRADATLPPEGGADATTVVDSAIPIPPKTDAPSDAPPADVGSDVAPGLGALGSHCGVNANCTSGLCGDTSILTDAVITAAGGAICTRTCCKSEECPSDSVCFGGGTGGSYCVRASLLPRWADAGALGASPGGATCPDGGACRSGVCQGGLCTDSCCSNSDCGSGGAICRQETVDGHQVFACGTPPASATVDNANCTANPAKCASGVCVSTNGINAYCRPRCCGQKSCVDNPKFPAGSVCAYLQAEPTTETLTGCFEPNNEVPVGPLAVGDTTCTANGDCITGICALGATRMCTDICCEDTDCSAYAAAPHCRPSLSPNPHNLTCQP